MGKWKLIAIVGGAVLVVAVAVVVGRMVFATKDEAANPDASAVKTAMVERGDIAVTIDATGTIKPLNIVKVSSKASGKILELKVDAGDYVEKDEIIAIIETTYVQISLEQASSRRAICKSTLATGGNRPPTPERTVGNSDSSGTGISR